MAIPVPEQATRANQSLVAATSVKSRQLLPAACPRISPSHGMLIGPSLVEFGQGSNIHRGVCVDGHGPIVQEPAGRIDVMPSLRADHLERIKEGVETPYSCCPPCCHTRATKLSLNLSLCWSDGAWTWKGRNGRKRSLGTSASPVRGYATE